MNHFKTIMDSEKANQKAVEELKTEIYERIAEAPALAGTTIQEGNLRTATIRFSSLGPHLDLSPETYFPKEQAKEVLRKIAPCNTVTDIMRRLREMVSARRIKWEGHSVTLNQNTLQVLQAYIEEADHV